MQVDETLLASKYDVVKLSVLQSTQIANRTASVVAKLTTSPAPEKQVIVALTAKHNTANKLISIVEIAKRELAAKGVKVYQHNALRSELIEIPRVKTKETGAAAGPGDAAAEDSDDAFESMATQQEGTMKKRLVPIMTTYLSSESVKELKPAYG